MKDGEVYGLTAAQVSRLLESSGFEVLLERRFMLKVNSVTVARKIWVYPGFPTLFLGLSGFFVNDLMGKALWKLVKNAQRFPRCGGRVLCVHGAGSFHRAHPYATRSPRPRTAVDP